jgi:hypothetical protein
MITFTVPAEMRPLFWAKQRTCYDLLFKTAWDTIDSFARRNPELKGRTGAMLFSTPTIACLVITRMCI